MDATRCRERRLQLCRACLAFLLPVLGLGLVARTAIQDQPLTRGPAAVARLGRDDLPGIGVSSPARSLQEILAHPDLIPTHAHPLLGRQAPDFALADPAGKVWNLREVQADSAVVLIFSYGFHCKNCVRQLIDINQDLPLFRALGAQVVAISPDPPEMTRRRFAQSGAFDLLVLSDPGNKVAQRYQVLRPAQDGQSAAHLLHGTFLLDRQGTVGWINVGDAPLRRNSALLCQLARQAGRLPAVPPGREPGKQARSPGGTRP